MPRKVMAHCGLTVGIVDGSVQQALTAIATGGDLSFMAKQGFHCSGGTAEERAGCS